MNTTCPEYAPYRRVKEALKERDPHRPVVQGLSLLTGWGPSTTYDLLAGNEDIESSHSATRSRTLEAIPVPKRSDLVGAHNDFRISVSTGLRAALHGASVVYHSGATVCRRPPDASAA
ncbi:hypothetical protein CTA1_1420 [Colletotrichum tanaceti]|uniref:Uncharacterized protein n=1 Tax=Colletotrichum tanaceti TaxID=1306861 RepID=A0A4V6DIT7_9PEZI|nr:hypothetical protein CTA1_1420 [Colletotrichum tanaceti]